MLTGDPVDPDPVVFGYQVRQDGEPTSFTYGAEGSPIVRDDTGLYHLQVDSTPLSPGNIYHGWLARGGGPSVGQGILPLLPAIPALTLRAERHTPLGMMAPVR